MEGESKLLGIIGEAMEERIGGIEVDLEMLMLFVMIGKVSRIGLRLIYRSNLHNQLDPLSKAFQPIPRDLV